MRISTRPAFAVAALTLAIACGAAWADDSAAIAAADEDAAFSLALEAYVWGYPLVITAATQLVATDADKPLPNGHAPVNMFGNVAKLFTAADTDVVSSNVDTVYSSAFVDLKQGAALVSVPDTNGRYYSLMLEDAYTNVFGYVGLRATGDKAGKYLITGPGWTGTPPAGIQGVIAAPTPLVWIIGRTLVDNETDLVNVKAIQSQYQIEMVPPVLDATPLNDRLGLTIAAKTPPSTFIDAMDATTYFHWVGQMMRDNPPPDTDSALVSQFAGIGLTVANGFDTTGLSGATLKGIERGFKAGLGVVRREALRPGGVEANGWAFNLSQGKWGQDFKTRAAIAYRGVGQNTTEEALYFNALKDGKGETLTGASKYTLTFAKGMQPPVDAFWSITMYNDKNFFVANPIDRLAIGNRTPGLKTNEDGSLTIYIQKDSPGADKESNWLPAPEGSFRLSMRAYNPKPEVLSGQWQPPPVQKE